MKTNKIQAIFESELKKVLLDLGLWENIVQGKINCYFCQNEITFDNLQYIIPRKNKIFISCNKPECVLKVEKLAKNES